MHKLSVKELIGAQLIGRSLAVAVFLFCLLGSKHPCYGINSEILGKYRFICSVARYGCQGGRPSGKGICILFCLGLGRLAFKCGRFAVGIGLGGLLAVYYPSYLIGLDLCFIGSIEVDVLFVCRAEVGHKSSRIVLPAFEFILIFICFSTCGSFSAVGYLISLIDDNSIKLGYTVVIVECDYTFILKNKSLCNLGGEGHCLCGKCGSLFESSVFNRRDKLLLLCCVVEKLGGGLGSLYLCGSIAGVLYLCRSVTGILHRIGLYGDGKTGILGLFTRIGHFNRLPRLIHHIGERSEL